MFISEAYAQAAETVAQANPNGSVSHMITQLVLIVFIVYFVLIRPQQKRIKKHEAELKAIIKGTQVIVAGLVGKVVGVLGEDKVVVEFADGVQIQVMRAYISQVIFDTPNPKK